MATEVIKTVKPSGGDYTSLSAWEAGQQGDLPTLDEIHTAECYSMEDTASVLIDGWITDATRYIKIYTPASERHDGKWNSAKYRLVVDAAECIRVVEAYVRIEGLQMRRTGTDWAQVVWLVINAATDIRVGYCIITSPGGRNKGIYVKYCDATIYNTVIGPLNSQAKGIYLSNGATANIYNCTIAKIPSASIGIQELLGCTATVKNTTVADTGDDFDFAGSGSIAYCASDDGDGTNAQTLSGTRTDDFVDFTNDDFHVVSGSVQVDNGVSDPGSGLYSDDIEGNSRSGSWDIGAFELTGGASITKIVAETYQFSESTLRVGASARVRNETYQLSEGLIRKGASTRLISETLNWGESLIRKLASIRIVAETVQFGEGIIRKLASLRLINETTQWGESLIRKLAALKLISETIQLSENVLKWLGIFKLVNEATQWGEGILRRSGFVKLVNETVQWGEGLIRRLTSIHLISETVQFSESLIRKLTSIRIIGETVEWGESLIRKLASIRLVTETVSFIENTIYQRGIKRIINETLTWAESIIKALGVSQILDLFKPQLKSLKQRYQLKSLKQKYQLKSLKQRYQIKWLG